jgi:hypothetical protein
MFTGVSSAIPRVPVMVWAPLMTSTLAGTSGSGAIDRPGPLSV